MDVIKKEKKTNVKLKLTWAMSILTLTHMPPSLLGNPEIDTPRSDHVTKKEKEKPMSS
jgi:hypothetical protein